MSELDLEGTNKSTSSIMEKDTSPVRSLGTRVPLQAGFRPRMVKTVR